MTKINCIMQHLLVDRASLDRRVLRQKGHHVDEDDRMEDNTAIAQAARIGKRKRRRDWELVKGGRDYESYISGIHERLNPFVYGTIDKWNKKLRLTSDKTTSKVRGRGGEIHIHRETHQRNVHIL